MSFYTGVPGSQLKPLCNYLINTYGICNNHIIATNESNAVALAAGYHLSTGKIPCVYLQNSCLVNITNPAAPLLNDKVCGGVVAYSEDDKTNPINIYGKSKLAGEEEIKKTLLENFLISLKRERESLESGVEK